MIIYFISIIGFVFFSDAFKDAINGNENSCTTAWQCYLTTTHRVRNIFKIFILFRDYVLVVE